MDSPLSSLTDGEVVALDGRVGAVRDLYFDDREWTARYLVVGTEDWLGGNLLLIPASGVERGARAGALRVATKRAQLRRVQRCGFDRLRSLRGLVGRPVTGRDGRRLGRVVDVELDARSWAIRRVVVEGAPGRVGRRRMTVRFSTEGELRA